MLKGEAAGPAEKLAEQNGPGLVSGQLGPGRALPKVRGPLSLSTQFFFQLPVSAPKTTPCLKGGSERIRDVRRQVNPANGPRCTTAQPSRSRTWPATSSKRLVLPTP